MEIKPLDEKAWDIKEGDFVVSNYDQWVDCAVPQEYIKIEIQQENSDKGLFPVLIGIVVHQKDNKATIRYLVLDCKQRIIQTDYEFVNLIDNLCWFKYDLNKLGINKKPLCEELEKIIVEKYQEIYQTTRLKSYIGERC